MIKIGNFFWASLIPKHWVLGLATLGGVGRSKYAPGTLGSLLGILWWVTVFTSVHGISYLILMVLSLYFTAGICEEAAMRIGKKDPSEVILDEFVAIPLCFVSVEVYFEAVQPWIILLLGFGLFRLFDIWKPFPISRLDKIEGGWGILLDDVGAALISCVILHLLLGFGGVEWITHFLS